jgi:hypothetical protein
MKKNLNLEQWLVRLRTGGAYGATPCLWDDSRTTALSHFNIPRFSSLLCGSVALWPSHPLKNQNEPNLQSTSKSLK